MLAVELKPKSASLCEKWELLLKSEQGDALSKAHPKIMHRLVGTRGGHIAQVLRCCSAGLRDLYDP